MELLEIMGGKYMQDRLVSGTGQVMYANCCFSLTEDRWMKIENSNRCKYTSIGIIGYISYTMFKTTNDKNYNC